MSKVRFYSTESRGLQLIWGDGWIEVFPETEFEEKCTKLPRKIRMYHKRKTGKCEPCFEEYYLTVNDKMALLDYGGAFEEANSGPNRSIYIGELKIFFHDNTRCSVKKILWRDKGKKEFEEWGIVSSWELESLPHKVKPFVIPSKQRKVKHESLAVLRSGQLKFRKTLLEIYNERCSITGFDVKEALEAAHIVPFGGKQTDHI